MAVPQKGLRSAASALVRRRPLLLPALLVAVAAAVLSTVFVYRAALADALLTQLRAASSQRPKASATYQAGHPILSAQELHVPWRSLCSCDPSPCAARQRDSAAR